MHNSKTCCLEQSDGQNFLLLYSQSNAEKRHMIIKKSDSPKCRTTGQYICWSHSLLNVSETSCLPLLFRGNQEKNRYDINKSTSTKWIERRFSRKESVRDVQSWPISMHLPSSICRRCCQTPPVWSPKHSRLQIFGYLVNHLMFDGPQYDKLHSPRTEITRKSPKARYQVRKAVALSSESGAETLSEPKYFPFLQVFVSIHSILANTVRLVLGAHTWRDSTALSITEEQSRAEM